MTLKDNAEAKCQVIYSLSDEDDVKLEKEDAESLDEELDELLSSSEDELELSLSLLLLDESFASSISSSALCFFFALFLQYR